jgi:hypothetical protein
MASRITVSMARRRAFTVSLPSIEWQRQARRTATRGVIVSERGEKNIRQSAEGPRSFDVVNRTDSAPRSIASRRQPSQRATRPPARGESVASPHAVAPPASRCATTGSNDALPRRTRHRPERRSRRLSGIAPRPTGRPNAQRRGTASELLFREPEERQRGFSRPESNVSIDISREMWLNGRQR